MADVGDYRSEAEERQCPKCQEERLVIATTIYGRKSYYCEVCSCGWLAQEDIRDVSGVVIDGP